MATGPPASRAWEDSTPRAATVSPSSLGLLKSHDGGGAEYNGSPSWRNSRILPPLRRFSDARLAGPEHWRHQHVPPYQLRLPPLDTGHDLQTQPQSGQSSFTEHFPNKRRRVEGSLSTGPNLESPPNPIAESPALLVPRGQPAPSIQNSQLSSHRRDAQGYPSAIARQDFAWESHAGQTARDFECCRPGCQGPSCTKIRSIVQELVSEICARDPLASTNITIGHQPPKPISPDKFEIGTADALEWALQRLRWNNTLLNNLNSFQAGAPSEPPPLFRRTPPFSSPLEGMKRQHDAIDKDADMSSRQTSRSFHPSVGSSSLTSSQPDDVWRNLEAMDPPGHHLRHNRSASFSSGAPFASPVQASQAARTLPSPSSLNLPIPPNLPPISSPSPLVQSSAHAAHLQDLQHQVSVKTLALQTLQREYDALLQKLERQRIRCQTLEKKFEVSDAEINSLTDEKERLANQVQSLEAQVEELQQARDEARKMGAESASQYMKIVEMAGRLQGKGVEDKKGWEKERERLLTRIRDLEGESSQIHNVQAVTSAGGLHTHTWTEAISLPVEEIPEVAEPHYRAALIEAARLRKEVQSLKDRMGALESALQTAQDESRAVREAALKLAGSGQRIDSAASTALGNKEEET